LKINSIVWYYSQNAGKFKTLKVFEIALLHNLLNKNPKIQSLLKGNTKYSKT